MTLREPVWILGAALIPVAWWLGTRVRPARSFPSLALWRDEASLPATWRTRCVWLPRALVAAGLACLFVVLARPATSDVVTPEQEGIDILLCLDASSSMQRRDWDPVRTRWDVARDAALRFVAKRRRDRIGLVAFARYPTLRCPPTLDHEALSQLLAKTRPVASESDEDATGLGLAVAHAARTLSQGGVEGRPRIAIVFTDGDENVALVGKRGEVAPAHAAQLCERLGVRVYPIVVGSKAPAMQRLAARTGGTFLPVRDPAAVDAVFATIDRLETGAVAAPRRRWRDRSRPFLLGALWGALLAWILRSTALRVLA